MQLFHFTATGNGGTFNDHEWFVWGDNVADAMYQFNDYNLYDEDCVKVHSIVSVPNNEPRVAGTVAWMGVKRWEGQELVAVIHDADIMVTDDEEEAQQERENDENYY